MSTGEKIEDFIASILSCITYNIVVPTVNNVVLLFANNVVLPQEQCCATTGTMLCYHRNNVVLPQEQCCATTGTLYIFLNSVFHKHWETSRTPSIKCKQQAPTVHPISNTFLFSIFIFPRVLLYMQISFIFTLRNQLNYIVNHAILNDLLKDF